jgi:hypothetical protein
MAWRRPALRAQLFLLLIAGSAAGPALADLPRLNIEAPPELAGDAAHLRGLDRRTFADTLRITGLTEAGPPIRVVLAPERSELARSAPPFVAGWAWPEAGTVVLLPARAVSYPDSSLDDVLRHEIAHVLIARAAGGRPVPRWFHEGVALVAGSSWGLDDRSRLTLVVLRRRVVPLAELDAWFAGDRGRVAEAYAVAGGFVRTVLERHGPDAPGRILAGIARGLPFDAAFAQATGEPLAAAEAAFRQAEASWERWLLPALTSPFALWGLIVLLAAWARRRRAARAADLHRRWEEEAVGISPVETRRTDLPE